MITPSGLAWQQTYTAFLQQERSRKLLSKVLTGNLKCRKIGIWLINLEKVYTPEQAADFLQVNRETIYRYIRDGKLVASRLGRTYRVPRRSLELLLWATRTRDDASLREYSGQEIEDFFTIDRLDGEAQSVIEQLKATRQ